jgi:flagellar P-ring protein precursor FlgI
MNIRSFAFALLMLISMSAAAERVKDIATVLGVRENQLLGYGLVVGLDGSGDQTTQTPFTVQSTVTMLAHQFATEERGGRDGDGIVASVCASRADHRHHGIVHR